MSAYVKVLANGYAFVYLSNNSNINVWFDNFVVTHERGRILQENHYYPYGLQIASISSKAAGKMDNMYRYQGAYSEFEEETGWNDFELRTYDAQIGRWTGVDPYDEFAGPYTGMGNDPVNNVDPSGGFIFGVESAIVHHAMWTGIGAIGGALYGGFTHGFDSKEVYQYAAWGAGAGAVASMGAYVPWDKVGGAFGDVGSWASRQLGGFFSGNGGWQDLYKRDLIQYFVANINDKLTDQNLGTEFEKIFSRYVQENPRLRNDYKITLNRDKYTGGDRNTVPDFTGSTYVYQTRNFRTRTIEIPKSSWFELKAKEGGLYLSSNTGQVQGHIDNLDREFNGLKQKYRSDYFKPKLYLITTADVAHSSSISNHAKFKGVSYEHIHGEFKRSGSAWKFRFQKSIYVH